MAHHSRTRPVHRPPRRRGDRIGQDVGLHVSLCRLTPRVSRWRRREDGRRPGAGSQGRLLPPSPRHPSRHGREADYVEVSLDSPYRHNPLHNDLDAYALVYGTLR